MAGGAAGGSVPSVSVIQESLRHAGLLSPHARVSRIEDAGLAGPGLVGDVRRLRVHYEGAAGGSPSSVVLKTPMPRIAEGAQLALVEREFYRLGVAPAAGVSAPAVLWFGDDGELLLEDLGADGFVRQADGYRVDQAELAIREVAKLHAGSRAEAPDRPEWLRSPVDSQVAAFSRREFENWDGGWPTALSGVARLLAANFDEVAEAIDTAERTIAHGDFHSQNVHLGADHCTLIDFQFVQRASGMLDVARLLATSLTTETRRAAEHDLLAVYEEVSGIAVDRDALRAAFLWNFGTPLALHLMAMKAQGGGWPERLPILERCLTAAEDWDAADLFG
jgi:hypothetical protein